MCFFPFFSISGYSPVITVLIFPKCDQSFSYTVFPLRIFKTLFKALLLTVASEIKMLKNVYHLSYQRFNPCKFLLSSAVPLKFKDPEEDSPKQQNSLFF